MYTEATIYVDGASRGNPGDAALGVVIYDSEDNVLEEISDYIGQATNNVAEYRAFIRALMEAGNLSVRRVTIYTDSELLTKQLNGRYEVRSENLKPLYATALELTRRFDSCVVVHVPRERNSRADRLANDAIDKAAAAGRR